MEKFLLCGEISSSKANDDDSSELGVSGRVKLYKGRRRGTVEFCGIWKHNKTMKELVASGVSESMFPTACQHASCISNAIKR